MAKAMSLADDLRAAKAMIDTPEKWSAKPGIVAAIQRVTGSGRNFSLAIKALRASRIPYSLGSADHADIMALFDRAIGQCGTEGERQ